MPLNFKSKLLLFLTCALFALACKSSHSASGTEYLHTKAGRPLDSLYHVYKIDSVENVYTVYASRMDRKYKLVSLRDTANTCRTIKLGGYYQLMINSATEITIKEVKISLKSTPHVGYFSFYGAPIALEWETGRELFGSPNLKGLCYVEWPRRLL